MVIPAMYRHLYINHNDINHSLVLNFKMNQLGSLLIQLSPLRNNNKNQITLRQYEIN